MRADVDDYSTLRMENLRYHVARRLNGSATTVPTAYEMEDMQLGLLHHIYVIHFMCSEDPCIALVLKVDNGVDTNHFAKQVTFCQNISCIPNPFCK